MLGRVDRVPGIAGDVPALRRLVLQRIEILGLAAQQVEHLDALEQAARVALAHEPREIGAEERGEDRVGLGVGQRLHHRAGVDLAERRRLLGDELDVGLRLLQQLLEGRASPTGRTRSWDRRSPSASSSASPRRESASPSACRSRGAGGRCSGCRCPRRSCRSAARRRGTASSSAWRSRRPRGRRWRGRCRSGRRPSRASAAPRRRAPRRPGCRCRRGTRSRSCGRARRPRRSPPRPPAPSPSCRARGRPAKTL